MAESIAKRWRLALLTVAASAISASATAGYAALAGPLARVVDDAVKDPSLQAAATQTSGGFEANWIHWILALLGVGLVRSVAEFARAYWATRIQQGVVQELRQSLLARLLALPMSTLSSWSDGEVASRLQVEIHGVRAMLHLGVSAGLGSLLVAIALATLAIQVDTQLAIAGLIALPLGIVALFAIGRPMRRLQRKLYGAESELVGRSAAAFRGVEVLKSFRAEDGFMARMDALADESARRATAGQAWGALVGPVAELSAALGVALVLALAFAREGAVDVGPTATVLAAMVLMFRPLRVLGGSMLGIWSGLACLDRLDQLWALGPVENAPTEAVSVALPLQLDRVDAGYDGRSVLQDVSLAVGRGEIIAVTGASGAGKSTLLRVIAGLLEPSSGTVSAGTRAAVAPSELRSLCTWMPQESWLFEGTVRQNIVMDQEPVDETQLELALAGAAAVDVVAEMGRGLDSAIARDGQNLSAGQRQRLCIARSLYRRTAVLVFDEPTSALDDAHEAHVIDTFQKLARAGHTVVVATHQDALVQTADRVLHVEHRRVTEQGGDSCAQTLH